MPVINLPQDTRWGDLGQGVGKLLGGLASAYQQKQVQEGVAMIQADDSIPVVKKPMEIQKQFGAAGIDILSKLNALETQRTQAVEHLARSNLLDVEAALKGEELPTAARVARAKAGLTEAQGVTEAQKPALLGAETAEKTAQAANISALTQPKVELTRSEAAAAGELGGLRQQQAMGQFLENKQFQAIQSGGSSALVDQAKIMVNAYPQLSPDQTRLWQESLVQAGQAAGPGKAAAAMATRLNALAVGGVREAKAAEVHPIEADAAKIATQSSGHAAVLTKFTDALKVHPEEFGLLSGAGLWARAARIGLPIADETLQVALETQKKLKAAEAKSGAVFMSAQTLKLGNDISPNLDRSPMSNWVGIDATAKEKVAELTSTLQRYEGVTPKRQVKPIEDALAKWQGIQQLAGSLRTVVSPDNRTTAVYFDGKQVDPYSFKELFDPAKTYNLGPGYEKIGGKQIMETLDAQKRTAGSAMEPAQAIEAWRRQYGYKGAR